MPIIPITILKHKVWVYVDSGATFSIFHADTANRLDIDIHTGKKRMIVVGDGSFIPVYFHNLTFEIDKFKLQAPIGFSERLGVGFDLLGRKAIFDNFQICFNEKEHKLTFQKI
jgi:hypothetical protein